MIKLASFPLIEKLYDLEVNDTNINLFRGSVVDVVKNAKKDDLTAMEAFILGAFFTGKDMYCLITKRDSMLRDNRWRRVEQRDIDDYAKRATMLDGLRPSVLRAIYDEYNKKVAELNIITAETAGERMMFAFFDDTKEPVELMHRDGRAFSTKVA